jgi:HD-GYP domain-containing protein (c-di-GMP phosphodiesterase class II)
VADVAAGIATALGWPEESVGRLRDAARVHDVGKIGVPDSVLLKPGPLTPDEFRRMQLHAELGAQIAEEVLDDDQVAWIRAHHERQDGSGYPSALAGGAIPEGAAILALADAWDVMTSDRPYRTGMDPRDAVAECRRCAGTQFAEEVVQAFLRL